MTNYTTENLIPAAAGTGRVPAIKIGNQVFPVSGTDTSDATATAADILNGKTAYIASGKVTGNLVPSGGMDDLEFFDWFTILTNN